MINVGQAQKSGIYNNAGFRAKKQNLGGGKFCLFAGCISGEGARHSGRSPL